MVLSYAMSWQSKFIYRNVAYHTWKSGYAAFFIIDFLGNFRSTVLLVSSAPGFVSLPCITPSSATVETLRPAQNILRNTALLRFPRKYSYIIVHSGALLQVPASRKNNMIFWVRATKIPFLQRSAERGERWTIHCLKPMGFLLHRPRNLLTPQA